MNPFEIKRHKYGRDLQLLGGYFPREVVERFGLIAVVKGESRSSLLKTFLDILLDEEPDNDILTTELAGKAYKEWKRRYESNKGSFKWKTTDQVMNRYKDFKKEVEVRLKAKKLSEKHIQSVVYKMGHISLPLSEEVE